MPQKVSSSRLVAAFAVALLCITPAVYAAGDSAPVSVLDVIQEVLADVSEWIEGLVDPPESSSEEPEPEDSGVPEYTPVIEPVG